VKFYPILFSGLILCTACGDPNDFNLEAQSGLSQESPIINGELCSKATNPSALAVMNWLEVEFQNWLGLREIRVPSCSGILIAPDTVLTAAHCLDVELLNLGDAELLDYEYHITFEPDLSVYAEYPATPFPDDSIKAKQIIPHPDFNIHALQGVNGPGDYADVGLIFLEKPVTHVEPAILITPEEASQIKIRTPVKIAGWGMSTPELNSMDPNAIGTAGVKYCAESEINELGDMEMQIGSDTRSSRKCHGDSGGPSYMDVNTTTARYDRVVGITSHTYDTADCYKGGVDTRADVWFNWIDSQMQKNCANGTRVWCDVYGVIPPEYYNPPAAADDSGCDCTQAPAAGIWFLFLLIPFFRRRMRLRKS